MDVLNFVFRTSKKTIGNVCRGFFSDYRHLENMFKYLANTSLTDVVEKNFKQQMGKLLFEYENLSFFCFDLLDYLEAYLRESIQTAEFAQFLENAEIKCDVEFDGSSLFKWICILVFQRV